MARRHSRVAMEADQREPLQLGWKSLIALTALVIGIMLLASFCPPHKGHAEEAPAPAETPEPLTAPGPEIEIDVSQPSDLRWYLTRAGYIPADVAATGDCLAAAIKGGGSLEGSGLLALVTRFAEPVITTICYTDAKLTPAEGAGWCRAFRLLPGRVEGHVVYCRERPGYGPAPGEKITLKEE